MKSVAEACKVEAQEKSERFMGAVQEKISGLSSEDRIEYMLSVLQELCITCERLKQHTEDKENRE